MSLDILIVDDHAPMRMMLRAVLERSGAAAHVREAANGVEALQLMAERPAQFVLCDHSMPGMSGVEFVLRLRADARHADVRVLMLSGHSDPHVARAARAAGVDAVLTKPVQSRALLEAIGQLMPSARAAVRA